MKVEAQYIGTNFRARLSAVLSCHDVTGRELLGCAKRTESQHKHTASDTRISRNASFTTSASSRSVLALIWHALSGSNDRKYSRKS